MKVYVWIYLSILNCTYYDFKEYFYFMPLYYYTVSQKTKIRILLIWSLLFFGNLSLLTVSY